MAVTSEDLLHLKRQYKRASKVYHNTDKTIMTDAAFNKLEDKIRKLDPDWSELKKTGAAVEDKKTEKPLLEYMPSLNKMYPEAVEKFYARKVSAIQKARTWIWMDKLDGTSLQLTYVGGRPVSFMTRGDGTLGKDISFFIPWLLRLKRIPATVPTKDQITVRMEALMKIKTFEKKWSRKAKGKAGWDNIRNGVNGLFNKKQEHPALSDVDLIVLGVYHYTMEDGLAVSQSWGFNTVRYSKPKGRPSVDDHEQTLVHQKATSHYEMDGLVIVPSDFTMEYTSGDKPKAMIAFKFNDEEGADEVEVQDIIWQKTRLKRWIPKIKIIPTHMDGVMVTHAAAHNAKWMKDRGIGPGAIVKVLRSGGVIPKIVSVVKKAKFKEPPGPYHVNGVHFIMTAHDISTEVRGIHHFMTTLGIENLAGKTLEKLYEVGFTTPGTYIRMMNINGTIDKLQARKVRALMAEAGISPLMADKHMTELTRVLSQPLSLLKLMIASGCFEQGGMGRRKLEQLEAGGVDLDKLIRMNAGQIMASVLTVHGFKAKTTQILINGIKKFNPWLAKASKYITVEKKAKKAKAIVGPLSGINVAWTSYRSAEQEAKVTALGGTVVGYGAKMHVLLYKPGAKFVDKIVKAGDKAMAWSDFCSMYKVK